MKAGDLVADRYRLLRTIGEGGMGSVWAAHHELIGRDVAIKVTGEKVSQRREIRERFLNEARAVGKVRHPNVIDVMDVGQLPDGLLYIVFELLEGRTLEEHLQKKGRLPAGDAAMILIEVCKGLEAAHAAGIVHRDLKPSNVFLHRAPGGSIAIKLLDFGISKTIDEEGVSLSVTQTGVVMGTPQYMSIEQARGRDDIDLRADIWSAGTILYELATGRVAFDAANYNAVIDRIMHEDALPLLSSGVNEPGLQEVVSRCLTKQRSQRYQTAKELRDALQALLPSLPKGAGGLKLLGSTGMGVALSSTESTAPPKPSADTPQPPAPSRHDATLVAPPSDPRITPLRNEPVLAEPPTGMSNRSPSYPSLLAERASRRRRGPLAAIVATVAVALGALIAFSTSGRSTETRATASPPAPTHDEATPVASPHPPPALPEQATIAERPSPTKAEPSARASAPSSSSQPTASAASRKAGPPRNPADATKPKTVTRIESAGF